MIEKLAFSMLLVLALPAATMAQQRTMERGRITIQSHQEMPGLLQQLKTNQLQPADQQGLQQELNQLQNGLAGQ